MSSLSSATTVTYPIQTVVWIDYGLRGRYYKGPFKDIQDKYHDISQVIEPMELMEYMRGPITFREFQALALWFGASIFLTAFITILYLIYIFLVIEEIEEGLAARDLYYLILLALSICAIGGYCYQVAQFRRKITEYVDGLNREIFAKKGMEFKMEFPWSCKGYRLTVTRFKADPEYDVKDVSLMEEV